MSEYVQEAREVMSPKLELQAGISHLIMWVLWIAFGPLQDQCIAPGEKDPPPCSPQGFCVALAVAVLELTL